MLSGIVTAETKKGDLRQFMIKTKIAEGNDLLSAPTVITQLGEESIIRISAEKYLPENWEIDAETMLPKPTLGDPTDFGISKKVTIKELEKDGQKLILLHGELILRAEEKTPELTDEKSEFSTKDYLFFQTEKKVRFAFDMTSRKKVSFKFKEGKKDYKVDIEILDPASNIIDLKDAIKLE